MQAVAPTRQGDTFGCRRHGGQAAHNGGPQIQHPQVCPGGVRPCHHPPEQSQPQPRLCGLQLPVGGGREPCVHPQFSHYAFLFGLKAAGGLSPTASWVCIHTVVWRGCCGLQFITKPLVLDTQSSGVLPSCPCCGCGAPDVNEVTLRFHVAAVSKR